MPLNEALRGGPTHVAADIAALPFQLASFHAVMSMEFARVLKPGGLLVLRASALDSLRNRHSIFAMERQRFSRSSASGSH